MIRRNAKISTAYITIFFPNEFLSFTQPKSREFSSRFHSHHERW